MRGELTIEVEVTAGKYFPAIRDRDDEPGYRAHFDELKVQLGTVDITDSLSEEQYNECMEWLLEEFEEHD